MANFFSKLFGKGKTELSGSPREMIEKVMEGIIVKGGFNLAFDVQESEEGFVVNISGEDSNLLTSKDGLLIDSFQIFLKRMLQNKVADQKLEVEVDCNGFLESSAQDLRELAERLKNLVLDKGQPSYVRALPPRDRKVVHRYLANEPKIKSQSVGEGFCKKIKISLVRGNVQSEAPEREESVW